LKSALAIEALVLRGYAAAFSKPPPPVARYTESPS
jgi:hypothetical protein